MMEDEKAVAMFKDLEDEMEDMLTSLGSCNEMIEAAMIKGYDYAVAQIERQEELKDAKRSKNE